MNGCQVPDEHRTNHIITVSLVVTARGRDDIVEVHDTCSC